MKIITASLSGAALDWAVCKCEHHGVGEHPKLLKQGCRPSPFSTEWSIGGPIIEREGITLRCGVGGWDAELDEFNVLVSGKTPLEAAMRCFVASKLGDEVEIPEELL